MIEKDKVPVFLNKTKLVIFTILVALIASYTTYRVVDPRRSVLPRVSLGERVLRSTPFQKDYTFSQDWFTYNIPIWEKALADYKDKPGINYLEIGVFEGMSVLWMLENILTHPTAKVTGIDPYINENYISNVKLSSGGGIGLRPL